MDKVCNLIFENLEFYTSDEKKKLALMIKNSTNPFTFIENMIEKIKLEKNAVKICETLTFCVRIDLGFTRDWLEEQNLDSGFIYLLIYAILQVNCNSSRICLDNLINYSSLEKNLNIPIRKDSLFY